MSGRLCLGRAPGAQEEASLIGRLNSENRGGRFRGRGQLKGGTDRVRNTRPGTRLAGVEDRYASWARFYCGRLGGPNWTAVPRLRGDDATSKGASQEAEAGAEEEKRCGFRNYGGWRSIIPVTVLVFAVSAVLVFVFVEISTAPAIALVRGDLVVCVEQSHSCA